MKRTNSGMAEANTHSRVFCFHYLRETRTNTFLKNTPTPRGNQLHQAYFLFNHDGMSDQNRWHSCKVSKIKAFSGFWGRFSKLPKFEFYRWHSVFGVKKRFWGSEIEKISLPFFVSENQQKVVSPNITIFEKIFSTNFGGGKNLEGKCH